MVGASARTGLAPRGEPGGLVARNRELAHLDHLLWKARAGSGSAVVLRGEPGVGKSALLEATVARAGDFGVVQLRGTALENPSGLPREWPSQVLELLGAHESRGLSELGEEGPARSVVPARLQLATTEALRSLFGGVPSPTLITVDDCQLLPAWFPAALGQAVTTSLAEAPVALVLAWRDTPHMPTLEIGLPQVPEHRLEGLNHQQAASLLRQAHGQVPTERVLNALLAATGGNPAGLLEATGRLGAEQRSGWRPLPEPLPMSDALAGAFSERLSDLAGDIRQAVAAAAAGRLPVSVLDSTLATLGLGLEALRPAQKAGILTIRGERLDFAHPLVRAAAFAQMPADFRAAVHAAISEAYAARGNVELSAFFAGQEPRRDESVARLYTQSARIALDRGDPETAARHEELASDFGATDDASALHLSRAAALWITVGEVGRARVCVDRAAGLASSLRIDADVRYQGARARLAGDLSAEVADEMLVAAKLCEADTPYRAVLMLVDTVACKLLNGCSDDSGGVAERALELSRAVSSHAEALAQATLGTVRVFEGARAAAEQDIDIVAATSLLIGQIQQFPASPQLAFVIGAGLLQVGMTEQAQRWARWIEDCSDTVGDRALVAVPALLRATAAVGAGQLADAIRDAGAAAEFSERAGQRTLLARALGILTEAHGAQGSYDSGFECAARLFGLPGEMGRAPRVQALTALAGLELQRGRASSAFAWLGAADDDAVPAVGLQAAHPTHDAVRAQWAPAAAEIMLLGRRRAQAGSLREVVERARRDEAVHPAWSPWIEGICTEDPDEATDLLATAQVALAGQPLLAADVELCCGVRLGEAGRLEAGREHVLNALSEFEHLGAQGRVELAERELAHLPGDGSVAGASADDASLDTGAPAFATVRPASHSEEAPWEISVLGGFAVHRFGQPVSLPLSLAAQGLKIVTINQRIPVDELVELLWPEAGPGVGTRRLRNVLWRVRAASGELLVRDDNFIRLADDAVSDIAQFRRLAEQALDRETEPETAARMARDALVLYRGELLPGDRYADWAAGVRESLARGHIQLLDLLLNDALAHQHLQEALALLERLIEADPYEEHHYVQAAELQVQAGNRRRALYTLDRAQRTLSELGVAPSRGLLQVRSTLAAD
ncbi:MAG TPA: AAA family ATPase [Acidimicrobiales bacterium]|nr:AAA family ATPase [Acidimicrobiales bacterium]